MARLDDKTGTVERYFASLPTGARGVNVIYHGGTEVCAPFSPAGTCGERRRTRARVGQSGRKIWRTGGVAINVWNAS